MNAEFSAVFAISQITSKQREVLDLLLDHKTSKEIAQILGISPHTVDQRIQFAKVKLGVTSRSDLARVYRAMLGACERLTYEESRMSDQGHHLQLPLQDEGQSAIDPEWFEAGSDELGSGDTRLVPELFEGQLGKWVRFISILAATFLILLVTLGGLAAYTSLSALLAN